MNLETVVRWILATLMTGAAITELLQLPAVMEGLELLGYPPHLVWILAPAKLLAVAALLVRPHSDLARAAYVGLWINLAGAVAAMALQGVAPMPDVIIAPAYLTLITASAWLHKRRFRDKAFIPSATRAVAISASVVIAAILAGATPAEAQERSEPSADAVAEQAPTAAAEVDPWGRDQEHGVETSVFWPIYPGLFFQLRGHVDTPVAGGGLLVGTQFRVPQFRETEGTFNNVDAQVGWRQHVWYGLHTDVLGNVGWGRLRDSTQDGQDYDSLDVEIQALLGWRQDLGRAYVVVQPLGLASVVYRSNPWPIAGEGVRRTEPPIYIGNILVGVTLGKRTGRD